MTSNHRKRRPTNPDDFIKWMNSRRTEMVKEADEQAEANGLDAEAHYDLLNAIVWNECTERANGNPARTRMLFDWEQEAIRQDQELESIETIIVIAEEADSQIRNGEYITAEKERAIY